MGKWDRGKEGWRICCSRGIFIFTWLKTFSFCFDIIRLAPFRGFIQERDLNRQEGQILGQTILYFGCRKKAEDFIYNEVCEELMISK